MAVTATPIFAQVPRIVGTTFTSTDTTTAKAIFTAGTNGSKVDAIFASSDSTAAEEYVVNVNVSSTDYRIGRIQIPITAGFTNAIPSQDVLRHGQIPGWSFDAFGNRCLYLAAGAAITIAFTATITSNKTVTFVVQGADF